MIQHTSFRRRYTCGQHVTGHGRQVTTRGGAILTGKERVMEEGVVVKLPGKHGDPYTVLDQQAFITIEAQEEHLKPLS